MADAAEKDKGPLRILIVDKDERFAAQVKIAYKEAKEKDPEGFHPRPVFAGTVRESQSYLSNRDYNYAGVFVNPVMGTPAWFAVVRSSHQYRAGTPVYVIYDEEPKLTKKDSAQLGVQGFMPKPLDYAKLLSLVRSEEEAQKALPEGQEPAPAPVKAAAEAPQSAEEYVTVELANVSGAAKSLFDLFVKLPSGKFVRILSEGDVLSKDRIEAYKAKGVTELYVLKSAQEKFLKFCDDLTAAMLKDDSVAMDVKAAQVSSQGAAVSSFLKASGFSEKSLEKAKEYVANTTAMVEQIAAGNDQVKAILADVASYEHGVAVATLAGLLIKHIGGQNPTVLNSAGVACFLHDVALLGQPQHVIDEDQSKMSEAELKIYLTHPTDGAKIVKKMKGVPPAVEQAVAEHHLRLNKKGFPSDKLVSMPNRLGELIGLCEEFVKLLKIAETDKGVNPIEILKARAAQEFSEPLVKAFVKAFDEK